MIWRETTFGSIFRARTCARTRTQTLPTPNSWSAALSHPLALALPRSPSLSLAPSPSLSLSLSPPPFSPSRSLPLPLPLPSPSPSFSLTPHKQRPSSVATTNASDIPRIAAPASGSMLLMPAPTRATNSRRSLPCASMCANSSRSTWPTNSCHVVAARERGGD